MVERERLLSQMQNHKVLITDRLASAIPKRDGSWFDIHGRYFDPSIYIYPIEIMGSKTDRMPSLEHTRTIAAHS